MYNAAQQEVTYIEQELFTFRPCYHVYIGGGEAALIPTFVGVGTILTAFFMGPLIDFFNRKFAIPFLNR